jgi:hypothetical protein
MALDDARKDALAGVEMSAFGTQTGAVKVFTKEDGVYGGQSYTIYRDSEDPDGPAKAAAVHKGVKTIKDKGIAIPTGLRVYCTKEYAADPTIKCVRCAIPTRIERTAST